MADRHADRAAPTMNDLADRFDAEHLSKRRPSTEVDYRSILRLYVRPTLGTMKVIDVRHTDIERLQGRRQFRSELSVSFVRHALLTAAGLRPLAMAL
jgi:hypothetical protein